MISELEAERDRLDEAILALERLSTQGLPKSRIRLPLTIGNDQEDDDGDDERAGEPSPVQHNLRASVKTN